MGTQGNGVCESITLGALRLGDLSPQADNHWPPALQGGREGVYRARRPEAAAPCEARPAPVRSLQASSAAAMLARMEGILGQPPRWMLARGLAAGQYYSRDGRIFERNPRTVSCGTLSAALRCAVRCQGVVPLSPALP